MSIDTTTPPAFMPVTAGCRHLGISRSRLYSLAARNPEILVQLGSRSLIDVARAVALIASGQRGPRRPGAKVVPKSPGRPRKSGGDRG